MWSLPPVCLSVCLEMGISALNSAYPLKYTNKHILSGQKIYALNLKKTLYDLVKTSIFTHFSKKNSKILKKNA